MSLDLRIAETAADRAACLALRREVFVDEQDISEADEIDGEDDQCTHVLAREDGHVIGAARYQYVDDYGKLQRICVPKHARGRGIGAQIIRFMIDRIIADGRVSSVRLGAQTHAIPFYEKLGFVAFGPVYDDAGIPHRDMELALNT